MVEWSSPVSGQVDSQVFVCISDFAGWPQVGKLLKGFTLLPNFLLYKRGTITTSNLVGISIVSKRCFFFSWWKRATFLLWVSLSLCFLFYLWYSIKIYNFLISHKIQTIFYTRILYRLRVRVVEEREAKRRDVKGVRGTNLVSIHLFVSWIFTFTFLSVLNFQFHFPWLGQYSGWKTFSACASSERTWGPKYSVGLTLEKLIFRFCFELIWFLSCLYLTYMFKIFKLQIHPKGDQSLPHCCHPFHCEWKTVILSQQSSKSPPSQSKSLVNAKCLVSLDRLYIAVPVSLLIWCWDWVQGQGGDPQHATAQEPFCRPFLGQNRFWLLFYHRVTLHNAIGKFFSPHFTFLWSFGFSSAPTQWVLLTVFAQIGKKWNSQQSNSSFLLALHVHHLIYATKEI